MRCNPHEFWIIDFLRSFFAPVCSPVLVCIPPIFLGLGDIQGYEPRRCFGALLC